MDRCLAHGRVPLGTEKRSAHVVAVLRGVARQPEADDRRHCRHEVGQAQHLVLYAACRDLAGPACQERYAMAPLPQIPLQAPQCRHAGMAILQNPSVSVSFRPVVAGHDDQSVVSLSASLDCGQHLPDRPVHLCNEITVKAGCALFAEILVRHDGTVWRQRREIKEPRLFACCCPCNESHRFLGKPRQHALEFKAGCFRSSVVVASHQIGRQVAQVKRQCRSCQHLAVLHEGPGGLGKPE